MTVTTGRRVQRVSRWSCLLAACLVLLAAVAAYAVEVYGESATQCGGLVQREPTVNAICDDYYDRRTQLVVGLVLLGVALLALAPFCSRRPQSDDAWTFDFSWPQCLGAAAAVSVYLPFAYLPFFVVGYVAADAGGGITSAGLPEGWKAVALATGLITASLVMRHVGMSERSAAAVMGLAVPLVLATQVAVANPLAGVTLDSSARLGPALTWLIGSVVLFGVLVLVATLQQRGWAGPPPGVGVATALAATAVVTVVLMPQLLPAYRSAEGGGRYPSDGLSVDVWAPVLVVLCVLSLLVIGAAYRSAGRGPLPKG